MSIANNNSVLEFLDLSLHINEQNEICVDVYAKPTNSFTYVLPSTCYPKKSINKVPKGIALRLRRICDSDEKFYIRSSEYQKYLIARDYNPTLVKQQFHSVRNKSRSDVRQVKPKSHRLNVNLVTVYNPIIKNLLYSDPEMKNTFPEGSINITCKRGKSLRELIIPSMFPQAQVQSHSMVSTCKSKRSDICLNYLVCKNEFTCAVTGKTYKVRGKLCCTSSNVIYLISCKLCKEQYIGFALRTILSLGLEYIRVIL